LALVALSCTGPTIPIADRDSSIASGGDEDAAISNDAASFACEIPAAAPTLEPQKWLHPAAPVAGQSLTIALQSQNTGWKKAPPLIAEIQDRNGTRTIGDPLIVGNKAIFYFTFGNLAAGENCIVVKNGDIVEEAFKIDVAKAPPLERGAGVWKIVSNHQWTCDEQPDWGNLLHVKVIDENGNPMEGVTVNLSWTDDTVYPVAPDDTAQNFQDHGQPKSMVTGGDGVAALETPWGTGIRSPVDAKPGYVVYNVSIAGGASDTATEISTGLWETNEVGCRFCNQGLRNVYGHWSYGITFQRQPDATEVCEVGTDHAGQQACSYKHFYHEDGRSSCMPVAP
jgi:hypothetical protein